MPRLPSLLAPLFLLTAAGCADLGERAGSGVCPDEPCSPTAPEGLEFAGPVFGGSWLAPEKLMAAGDWAGIEALVRTAVERLRVQVSD